MTLASVNSGSYYKKPGENYKSANLDYRRGPRRVWQTVNYFSNTANLVVSPVDNYLYYSGKDQKHRGEPFCTDAATWGPRSRTEHKSIIATVLPSFIY